MVIAKRLSDLEDLTVVLETWTTSVKPNIIARRVEWPELIQFTKQCSLVSRQSEGTESLDGMARAAYRAVRMLTCSPTMPSAFETGLADLVEDCAAFTEGRLGHSLVGGVRSLKEAAEALLDTRSPVREQVIGAISEFGRKNEMPWNGQPEMVLVVAPDLAEVSQAFLDAEELVAHVRTPEQIKQHRYRGVIVCGDLRTSYRSFWTSPEIAAKTYGWLITAPPANNVVLVETSQSRNRIDELWLLGPEARPILEVNSAELSEQTAADTPLFSFSHPKPVVEFDITSSGEHLQTAAQVLLASGRSVFYARGIGPQPRLVLVEEEDVETQDQVPIAHLAIGDLLVIRAAGSEYEEVRTRAEQDLMVNKGWTKDQVSQARSLVAELKDHLRKTLDIRGERWLKESLVHYGLTESHAKSLCRNPLDEHYIAPNTRGFGPLVRSIGAKELAEKEQWFKDLRTAHRQAGFGITSELNQRLSRDSRWLDEVAISGYAVIDDFNLGTLLIEAVAYPAEEGYEVPVTYLGRIMEGSPLRPIEPDKFRKIK